MKTRFGAAAGIVALMCSACGQRQEEPEPDPTANIDLPVMYNPDPSTLQDTTAVPDTTVATDSPGIMGDDTIPGPFNPDTVGVPRTP